MAGILYGIGVGPGDPELLTLKAVKKMQECDVLIAPGERCEDSIAYQIAVQAVPEIADKQKDAVKMPMVRDRSLLEESHRAAADKVIEYLKQGKKVGMLNLGDVTVYASYLYVHRLVKAAGYQTELINGVPSFCAAAARLNQGLVEGEEILHVLPGSRGLEEHLNLGGTKVIMKLGKQVGRAREQLKKTGQDAVMVENCGMPGERLYHSLEEINEDAGYYSLMIVKETKNK